MDGLFGPSPWEIQQAQLQATNQAADRYAQQDPLERAAGGMYRAGAGLAAPLAGMLGMQNPAVEQAKRTEQIMGQGDADLTTSKGILAKAEQFRRAGDMRTAVALLMKGKELEKQEAAAMLATRKQDFQEQEAYQLKVAQLAQQYDIARMRAEDSRNAAADRTAAAREANQIRLEIAKMAAAAKQGGGMSAAEAREMKYEDEKAAKVKMRQDAAQTAIDQLDAVERNINQLYDQKTGKLKEPATSIFGKYDQYRPDLLLSQDSVDALSALTGLKDQITMSNLADAKKAVGQSFGSMQVQEWDKFVRLLASLDRRMSPEVAASNLKYIQDFISKKKNVLNTALSAGSSEQKSPSVDVGMPPPGAVRRKGG